MNRFMEFNLKALKRELATGNKVLLVADFRGINYDDEDKTPMGLLSQKLSIEVYPVISQYGDKIINLINYYYQRYTVFVQGSLNMEISVDEGIS